MATTDRPKAKEVVHDETPSIISDHPYEPKGESWSLCGYHRSDGRLCNLAESAHSETTTPFRYVSDDFPDDD